MHAALKWGRKRHRARENVVKSANKKLPRLHQTSAFTWSEDAARETMHAYRDRLYGLYVTKRNPLKSSCAQLRASMMKFRGFVIIFFMLSGAISLVSLYFQSSTSYFCIVRTSSIREIQEVRLVILVMSYLKGKKRRDAIRETWMKRYRDNTAEVVVKFSIGIEGLSSNDVKKLTLENTAHGDLLLLPDLHDSYNNLTRKLLQSFVSLYNHYKFSYLLKCDDDVFVVLDTVLRELKERTSNQSYYWGYHYKRSPVLKEGKWEENKWFLCDTYLPYAAGGGYLLSKDLVRRLVLNSDGLVLYNNEDVSIGTWLSPYNVYRHHDVRFNTHPVSSKCSDSQIVIAEKSTEAMFAMQRSLDEGKGLCSSEIKKNSAKEE